MVSADDTDPGRLDVLSIAVIRIGGRFHPGNMPDPIHKWWRQRRLSR